MLPGDYVEIVVYSWSRRLHLPRGREGELKGRLLIGGGRKLMMAIVLLMENLWLQTLKMRWYIFYLHNSTTVIWLQSF